MRPVLFRGTDPGVAPATSAEKQPGPLSAAHRAALHAQLQSQRSTVLSIGPLAQVVEQTRRDVTEGETRLRDAQQAVDQAVAGGLGDNELVRKILDLMEHLQGAWLERYAEILGNYVALFDQITSALNKLQHAIKDTDSDGNFIVDFSEVTTALGLITNLGLGGNFASEEEAGAFLKELGVEWFEVAPDGPPFQLQMKLVVITDIIEVFQSSKGKLTPTEYNTLITSKDNKMERLMHMNRVLPDKNQRMLDLWNNLVDRLASTIDSLNEARMRFVNNLV